ncbi:hypothetical protein ACFX15_022198 [Malus domestica]
MVWDINGVGRGLEEHDGLLLDLMLESVGSTRLETSSGGISSGLLAVICETSPGPASAWGRSCSDEGGLGKAECQDRLVVLTAVRRMMQS